MRRVRAGLHAVDRRGRICPMDAALVSTSPAPFGSANSTVALGALSRFANRATPNQADVDAVMRALVEHDHWYVPAPLAARLGAQGAHEQLDDFAEAAHSSILT